MADEPETSGHEPNLELPPLLGFGRKKKARKAAAPQVDPDTGDGAAEEPTAPEAAAPVESSDPLAADPVPPPRRGLAPAAEKAKRPPPVPPPSVGTASVGQVPPPPPPPVAPDEVEAPAAPEVFEERVARPIGGEALAAVEPPSRDVAAAGDTEAEHTEVTEPATGGPETWARSETESEPATGPVITEPPAAETETDHLLPPETADEQTSVLATQGRPEAQSMAGASRASYETAPQVQVDEQLGWPVEEPVENPATESRRRGGAAVKLPVIPPRVAAVVTGAVVGLVGVLLSILAGRGCEAVRGVGSCGGIGLFALLVIVAIEVLIGAALLTAWRMYDPVSTSFLGVGLAAVFVLLFLLSSLESIWMVLVIPAVSAITFLISWWVSTSLVEGADSS